MSSSQDSARKLVAKKFASMSLPSIYWPTVPHKNLEWEIDKRIDNPNLIWQSMSNLCGMATFFNTLAWDDPYLYAHYVCEMYRCGAAYLGYGKNAPLVKPSKTVRSSKVPPMISSADWIALAALRDHLNDVLKYGYDAGIPVLGEIPLLGFFGNPRLIEPVGGITWPGDLVNMLKAVGYAKVVNRADWQYRAGPKAIDDANGYWQNGFKVLALIHSGIESDEAGTYALTADHWVRLAARIETKGTGVRAWVWNPAYGKAHWLPTSGKMVHRNVFNAHFFGFVAAKK